MGIQHTLKALSDPIRREILQLLKSGRLSAGEIAEKFPVSGAAISKHLSVLKDADLIRDTREGKYIYYGINTSVLEEVMLTVTRLIPVIFVMRHPQDQDRRSDAFSYKTPQLHEQPLPCQNQAKAYR